MITTDRLRAVHTIVTHANCPDGIASAILLHDVLPEAKIVFVQHQTLEHKSLPVSEGVLFVDFAPHETQAQQFVEAGAMILDHHKTARAIVEAFGDNGRFGDEVQDPGVCGAVLAFNHVWAPLKSPSYLIPKPPLKEYQIAKDFATLAGVRDTWQKDSPDWHRACVQAEMLRFFPIETLLADTCPFLNSNQSRWLPRMEIGELLIAKHTKSTQKAVAKSFKFKSLAGTRVVMLSNVGAVNDAAELLREEADLVVAFGYEVEDNMPKIYFSTRTGRSFDCGTFCKDHGGGGHTKAAGFNLPLPALNPYTAFRQVLDNWEMSHASPQLPLLPTPPYMKPM